VSRNKNNEFGRESESPKKHDSSCVSARASNDIAALRHWFGKDSDPKETDPLELDVQHIFHRKDDDEAQFEAETFTTPKEPTTNQKAGSLIVIRLNIQTWRKPAQSFISKNSPTTVEYSNYNQANSLRPMIGTQPESAAFDTWKNCVSVHANLFQKISENLHSFKTRTNESSCYRCIGRISSDSARRRPRSRVAFGESSFATCCQWGRIHLVYTVAECPTYSKTVARERLSGVFRRGNWTQRIPRFRLAF